MANEDAAIDFGKNFGERSSERFAGGSHANPRPSGRKRRRDEEFEGRKKSKKREEESKKRTRSTSSDDSSSITEEGSSQKRTCRAATRPLPLNISSYTLHCMLGTGTYGKVALASTATTKQLVAVKSIVKKPQKENMEAIVREARVLRVAAGHPFLCHAYAAFQTQTHAFFEMEYASGGSLMEITKRKHLKMRKVIFYSAEMICGLQYLHSRGIIHRDIKPDNVMLSSEGHIKIVDFGLAAEGVFGNNTIRGRSGTFAYMAPEVIRDKEYNAAADWWSFGITLYEMATGQLPFCKGNSLGEIRQSILRDQPSYPVWISGKLHLLLNELLKKKACNRLGINGNIREDPFYESIDWEELENQRVPPPFQPEAQSAEDFEDCRITTLQFLEERVPLGNYIIQDFSYQSPGWQA